MLPHLAGGLTHLRGLPSQFPRRCKRVHIKHQHPQAPRVQQSDVSKWMRTGTERLSLTVDRSARPPKTQLEMRRPMNEGKFVSGELVGNETETVLQPSHSGLKLDSFSDVSTSTRLFQLFPKSYSFGCIRGAVHCHMRPQH